MNRAEFMKRLAELLEDLPAEERAEALQFYNGYFYDAGPEHEAEILRELESPEAVSGIIHREVLGENWQESGSYRAPDYGENGSYRAPDYRAFRQQRRKEQELESKKNPWKIVAVIAICVIFSPVILTAGAVLFAMIVGIAGLLFGLVAGALALAVGLFVCGIVGLVLCVMRAVWIPMGALFGGGISLLAIGLGLLILWLFWAVACRLIPWIVKCLKRGWNCLFHRNVGEEQMK